MVDRTIIKTARGTLSDLQQRNQDEELIPFELVYLTDQRRLAICIGEGNPTPTEPSEPDYREIPTLNNSPGNPNVWGGANFVEGGIYNNRGHFAFSDGTLVLVNGSIFDAQGVHIILSEATDAHLVTFPDKSGTVAFLDDILDPEDLLSADNEWTGGNLVDPDQGGGFAFRNGGAILQNAPMGPIPPANIHLEVASGSGTHAATFPTKTGTVAFLDDIPNIPEGTQTVPNGGMLNLSQATFHLNMGGSKPPFQAVLPTPLTPIRPYQITIFRTPGSSGVHKVVADAGVEFWAMDGFSPGSFTELTFNQPQSFAVLTPITFDVWGIVSTVGVGLS